MTPIIAAFVLQIVFAASEILLVLEYGYTPSMCKDHVGFQIIFISNLTMLLPICFLLGLEIMDLDKSIAISTEIIYLIFKYPLSILSLFGAGWMYCVL